MSKFITTSASSRASSAENFGYGIGSLVVVLREVMPLRLWMTLGLSSLLTVRVFTTDAALEVARWTAVYLALLGLLIGSAVFKRR
jgi:hypothetical protein